jgi:hypothetical protein
LLSGPFEHVLNYLADREVDLRVFKVQFKNDDLGATDLLLAKNGTVP